MRERLEKPAVIQGREGVPKAVQHHNRVLVSGLETASPSNCIQQSDIVKKVSANQEAPLSLGESCRHRPFELRIDSTRHKFTFITFQRQRSRSRCRPEGPSRVVRVPPPIR
eukprot:9468153-Pyramimonas_sp.AAC.1